MAKTCQNVTFNPVKSKIGLPKVHYVGYQFSKKGLEPSPDHVEAIPGMPTPQTKEEVQRFNYGRVPTEVHA